jgi:YD repeat-containing protein
VFVTNTPGPFSQSHISYKDNGWSLLLRDGTLYVFGDNAPLQYVQDRFGNRITLTRAGPNAPISKISSLNGRSISLTYDSGHRITRATDNAGRTVSYVYDANGRPQT